ncbi:MAG: hypothetical protein Tsb0020_21620 [Haliangiales bacterium]
MAVTPEMERAGLQARLELAVQLQEPIEQLSLLHQLVEVELRVSGRAQAQGWLDQAQQVLDSMSEADPGKVASCQSEQRQLRERVARAPSSPPAAAPPAETAAAPAEGGAQPSERDVEPAEATASAPPKLTLGLPPAAIPERYAFARDGGPACPKNARYVPILEHERVAGFIYWSVFVVLALLTLMCAVIAITNLLSGINFNGVVSLSMAAFFGLFAALTSRRLRAAKDDARARQDGTYRLGWYFTPEALLLRMSSGFNVFPRERVIAARMDSSYSSETKYTRSWLVLTYRDDTDAPVELSLDFARPESQQEDISRTIEQWRKHGGI